MRISYISRCEDHSGMIKLHHKNKNKQIPKYPYVAKEITFGSSGGKIVGGILGTAAIIVAAPAIAAVGLAGLGTIVGMGIGHIIDEKIDEKIDENQENKKSKENEENHSNN